jgi:hypothetical protein
VPAGVFQVQVAGISDWCFLALRAAASSSSQAGTLAASCGATFVVYSLADLLLPAASHGVASGGPPSERRCHAVVTGGGAIADLAWCSDGAVLALACSDASVQLWHVAPDPSALPTRIQAGALAHATKKFDRNERCVHISLQALPATCTYLQGLAAQFEATVTAAD